MSIQNYRILGVKQKGNPDIITILEKNPKVISFYKEWCKKIGIPPFGGSNGTPQKQGNGIGKITSGYRDYVPKGGAEDSPHFYCIALDVYVPFWKDNKLDEKILKYAKLAFESGFTRLGLYPFKNIFHIDVADEKWCQERNAFLHCWVQNKNLHYIGFHNIMSAWKYLKSIK